jgi:hypothetical protein
MRSLGLGNGAFDTYVIYFSVIVLTLSLGVKVSIGASGDCKDCAMCWECFVSLLGFLGLWRRWAWWIGFVLCLGVIVLHWVGDLQNCWGYVIYGAGGEYVICGASGSCGWLVVV